MPDDFDLREFDNRTRLFPLPGIVLFPHVVLPLHIFEPRYRQMTQDALGSDQLITIIQARPHRPATANEPALEPVGCLGRIIKHERLPDGRFNLLLHGRHRVALARELQVETLYRQAEVELLEDVVDSMQEFELRRELVEQLKQASETYPELYELCRNELPLATLCDLLAHALPATPSWKQSLLSNVNVSERVSQLSQMLHALGPKSPPTRRYPPSINLN
jgi:Lon protease-like protein